MDDFADVFVPNIQTANKTSYGQWKQSNPNEAKKWEAFRDAAIAHRKGDPPISVPTMATKYGKALVAAGKLHVSVTDIGADWTTPPVIPPDPGGGTPIYSADFEFSDWREVESRQNPNHCVLSSSGSSIPAGFPNAPLAGSRSFLSVCGPEDANVAYAGSPPRAELSVAKLSQSTTTVSTPGYTLPSFGPTWGTSNPEGQDSWITWQMKILSGWDYGTANSWCVICQIESLTGSQTNFFALEAPGPSPSYLVMKVRGGTLVPGNFDATLRSTILMNPLPINQLLKMKIHHHWSAGGSGTVTAYINNVQVGTTINGANFWPDQMSDGLSPNTVKPFAANGYLKIGIYRTASGITHDSQVQYDSVRWWATDPGTQ